MPSRATASPVPMGTTVSAGIPHIKRQVARQPDDAKRSGVLGRSTQAAKSKATSAVESVKQKTCDAVATIRAPGKMARVKEWAIGRLPYHRQSLRRGTIYDAELKAPLTFGRVAVHASAPEGTLPAPASVLNARLVTMLDSATTPRGTPLEAVVTEPVFAEDGRLVLAEGTVLFGEVTLRAVGAATASQRSVAVPVRARRVAGTRNRRRSSLRCMRSTSTPTIVSYSTTRAEPG